MTSELNKNFPQPNINRPLDETPMIKRVRLDHAEIGSRASAMPTDGKNDMNIRHVDSMNK